MRPVIESLQNPKVKLAVRLRESRARRQEGLIIIDGEREIRMALQAGVAIESIYTSVNNTLLWPEQFVQAVSDPVLQKLAFGDRVDTVAVARVPEISLSLFSQRIATLDRPLLLVLDRAEKPGNVGAVARTVATAGAHGLVLTNPQCEVFNPNAIRASLGTVFSVPVAVTSVDELKAWLAKHAINLVRACVDGTRTMWSTDLSGPMAIALGSEAWGLGPEWNQPHWPAVQIPMVPEADSLNLSVSAAVLCYEALRQRATTHPQVE